MAEEPEVERRSHDWDGTVLKRGLNPDLAKHRNRMARAAKEREWEVLLELLNERPTLVNSVCLGSRSWFTPLHQAIYNDAPMAVLRQLIDLGAFRTLKSLTGQRPVDVARMKGFNDSADLLEPEIRHPFDAVRLAIMEELFHGLVRAVSLCYKRVEGRLRLPQLSVLTEFSDDALWFPIPGMYGGFHIWLEKNEADMTVIAESWCRLTDGSDMRHRITPFEVTLLEEGLV